MPVTRTNRKRWIGLCARCSWTGLVQPTKPHACADLADHLQVEHGMTETAASRESGLNERGPDMGIKQPDTDLPPQEGGVKVGDFVNKLVVFDNAREAKDDSSFGSRGTVHADLWVFDPNQEIGTGDGEEALAEKATRGKDNPEWCGLGEVIVWWVTVGKQILEVMPDQLAGVLTKGTDRNSNEWAVVPVPSKAKAMTAALGTWDPSF